MDRTTEAIAHFIGLFEIKAEQAWDRLQYDEAALKDPKSSDVDGLLNVNTSYSAAYELKDYDPGLVYVPGAPEQYMYAALSIMDYVPPELPLGRGADIASYAGYIPAALFLQGFGFKYVVPDIQILGSIANYINQWIQLSDNDYYGIGAHGFQFHPDPIDNVNVLDLLEAAQSITLYDGSHLPGSAEALKTFADNAAEELSTFSPEPVEGQTVTVVQAASLQGIFVNGVEVEEAPQLKDFFSLDERMESGPHSDEPLQPNAKLTENGWEIDASVDLETGSNVMINNVTVKNLWTTSSVTAVVGKHVEVNAIIQVNAWCDTDSISEALGDWDADPTENQTFNIAQFDRFDRRADKEEPDEDEDFPEHWVIKQIHGDVMVVNWMQQLAFMSDNDVGILSSSGVTTKVYSGQNVSYNDISIFELGFAYDLIIVGGDCYDFNIIEQLNILCDNDTIGTLEGFEANGGASYSTSGNLLWNQAYIYNIGGADRFESLPDYYRDAANDIASGKDEINDDVLNDSAFAGLGALRVLYISGDFINVQYLGMTNILGDSDQIALAMDAVGPHPEAEWNISTGSNALLNYASIIDLDSSGKTYVGGEQYSNDVLIQADIISTNPDYGTQDPDALVNEAVAFLTDDEDSTEVASYGGSGGLDPDNAHGDALQTLIG